MLHRILSQQGPSVSNRRVVAAVYITVGVIIFFARVPFGLVLTLAILPLILGLSLYLLSISRDKSLQLVLLCSSCAYHSAQEGTVCKCALAASDVWPRTIACSRFRSRFFSCPSTLQLGVNGQSE